MCFVWLSEETVTFAVYVINIFVFITETEGVYCAVRPESLYKADTFLPYMVNVLQLGFHPVAVFVSALKFSNEHTHKFRIHYSTPSRHSLKLRVPVRTTLKTEVGLFSETLYPSRKLHEVPF
jgi:hypothetical protein